MDKGYILNFLNEMDHSNSLQTGDESEPPESKENIIPNERIAFLLFPFFMDLINQFKDSLKNLRKWTRHHQEQCSDKETGAYLNQILTEDIKNIDLLQESLLNYIRINNPLIKKDTVNILIDKELKKYQVELEENKIKVFRTLEKDLPETAVPDDQLRYIVGCAMQYIMASIPTGESFGIFTKSLSLHGEKGYEEAPVDKDGRIIEILMIYTGHSKSVDRSGPASGISTRQKEGMLDLVWRLLDEVVQRNRGVMKFEADEKKGKTTVSFRFPVERRKVTYCQPAKEPDPMINPTKTTFEKLTSLEEMKRGN